LTRGRSGGVIEGMTFARGQRLWRMLIVVAALAGSGARGLCFMPGPATGPLATHDCGKTGWTAAPPTCCMEARVDQVPAIRMAKQAVPALSVIPAAFLHDEDSARLNEQHSTAPSSFHSPPTQFVLRV
jgi:hypothetical protein